MKLLYIDQYQLFHGRCNFTDDGIHYQTLKAVETMVMLNIAEKWC